jgi:hypothetical protein
MNLEFLMSRGSKQEIEGNLRERLGVPLEGAAMALEN